jgi:hypothetical protein
MRTLRSFLLAALAVSCCETRGELVLEDAPPRNRTPRNEAGIAVPAPASSLKHRSTPPGRGRIVFQNGDTLKGQLLGWGAHITWEHAGMTHPASFKIDSVSAVELGSSEARGESAYTVGLRSGGRLPAEDVQLDGDSFLVSTEVAGKLRIPRTAVESISSGVQGLAGGSEGDWTVIRGLKGWTWKGGVLSTTRRAAIGRKVEFPDRFRIQFDLEWDGAMDLIFSFKVPTFERAGSGGYCVRFRPGWVEMYRNVASASNRITRAETPELLSATSARFEIRFDDTRRRAVIFCNGRKLQEAHEQDEIEDGAGFLFLSQSGSLSVSNIRLLAWDGTDLSGPEEPLSKDTARLKNGDTLSGRLVSINKQTLLMKTEYGDARIPSSDLSSLHLAAGESPNTSSGSFQIKLTPEGSLPLEVDSIKNGTLAGRHPLIGSVRIPAKFIRSIQRIQPAPATAATENPPIEQE